MTKQSTPKILNAAGELVQDVRSPKEIWWEKHTTGILFVFAFLFLVGYSVLILNNQSFSQSLNELIIGGLAVIWVCFIVDYFVRLGLSTNRKVFFKKNIIDLFSLIIPLARPFLLLTYLPRIKIFRGKQGTSLRARLIVYAGFFSVMFVYVLSLAVYAVERDALGGNITDYGDSVWWAIVTITTVGYGDLYPVTVLGRVYASILMLGGVLIIGAATGTFVSFLNERVQVAHEKSTQHKVDN